jgi:glycine/D-amino acid oxidase-like deaminating enzyme
MPRTSRKAVHMDRLDDGALRLRTGRSVWQAGSDEPRGDRLREPQALTTDIVIIGAGITGAFLAERFTRMGKRVVLIDRRRPVTGSTAASTALLLWELDAPLLEIEGRLGLEAAKTIASVCRRAVIDIGRLVNEIGIDADFTLRSSLYLAGDRLDAHDLREERRLREAMGIETRFLEEGELAKRGFVGEGALVSPGAAEADPVKLARGLLRAAVQRGAIILSPATASVYQAGLEGVRVETLEGDSISAGAMVLANGYEMPDFVPAARHELVSTWVLATAPLAASVWPVDAVVWEAADPYLYMRATADRRIIAGGEDGEFEEAEVREAKTEEKVRAILAKLAARCPALEGIRPEFAWSGVFGATEDSLPMIGRLPGRPSSFAAFGYGGNGITFSAIAADVLAAELEGGSHPAARLFALDRE